MRLLRLASAVQAWIDEGELTLGHAKILAGIPENQQAKFARHAITRRLSVRALETAWRRAQASHEQQVVGDSAASREMAELERDLSEHLGNRVHIHYDPERRNGEVRVAFHDLDEFEGLLQRWGFRDPLEK